MAIQLVNKDGVLVTCTSAEELVAFFASNANANTEVKKEIARVVNTSNEVEESLLLSGSKELALTVIAKFFKGVGGAADAGDDAALLAKVYGGEFTVAGTTDADLKAKMAANGLTFKYVGTNVSVVDAQGATVTSIPTRDAEGNVVTTSVPVLDGEGNPVVDAEGNPVVEQQTVVEAVDFTVYNNFALTHLAAIIAASEGLAADAVKQEIEVAILDNTDTPHTYVDQYLNSSDAVLFNKALVHPKSDSAAQLASIKSNPLYPQAKKLELIAAVSNAAQFTAIGDLMKFFLDRSGQISEQDKAALQKATFLKMVNLSIDSFNASLSDDIKLTPEAVTQLKSIYFPTL